MNNRTVSGIEKLSNPRGLIASLAVAGREIANAISMEWAGVDPR